MERSVLLGDVRIIGPLSSGTGHKVMTWDPTTGRIGQVDNLISGVTGDISIDGSGVSSINAGVIVNADINASAAIAWSKMSPLTVSRVMVTDVSGFATTSITTTVFNYIANLSSDAQAQINTKQATIVGAASTVVTSNLSANKAVVSGAGGKIEAHPDTTLTEIGYVHDVTGPIQSQLNTKLTVSLSSPSSGQVIAFDGTNWVNAAAATGNLPVGGTANQYLKKVDGVDYNTTWGTLNLAALGVTASIAEVDFLIGAGANIQGQLNTKLSSALATDNLWVGVAGVATATTDLPTGTTIGSAVIYRVGGTDVVPADGGTGISSYAVGDILYASGATTISKLAGVATGNALISGGVTTAPSWGKIGLTTHVSGTLPIANGGTNITTYTTGDILYASASNVLSKLAVGTNGHVLTLAAGVPTWAAAAGGVSGLTTNRIPYATSATTLGDDSAFTWDATNNTITIGAIRVHSNGGTQNSFIGAFSGNFTLTGTDNACLGANTGFALTSGVGNVLIGASSGDAVTSGSANVAVGFGALGVATTALGNIAIGNQALNLTTGNKNIGIGNIAGANITSGTYNVIIGGDLDAQSATASGQLSIQNIIFGTGNTATGTTISSGSIGIGVTSPTRKFEVAGSVAIQAGSSTGQIARVGGVIQTDTTTTGNVGAGEDTLQTYSVPASTLATDKDTIFGTYSGTFGASLNNKRLRLKFGATTIFDSGALAITAATDWVLEFEIIRTGATTQKCNTRLNTSSGTLSAYADYSTAAETLSGAVTLLLTGEATADNDIVKEMFKLRWEPSE